MSTTCKYCNEVENKQDHPGLICESCVCFVHLSCLQRPGTPGDFACDVFFDFTCEDCSPSKKEVFVRNRFPWVNVIVLTLHHLSQQSYGISNHGFFHYKTHICSFIDRNWSWLFGPHFKQKKNWVGTIAGALSVYNNLFFQSGSAVLGETGWWRLLHGFSPAVASQIIVEMARDKPKFRPRNQMAVDKTLFIAKVTEMGFAELINHEEHPSLSVSFSDLSAPTRKRSRADSDLSCSYDHYQGDTKTEVVEECQLEESVCAMPLGRDGMVLADVDSMFRGFDFEAGAHVPRSDSSSLNSYQQSAAYYDSDTRSGSPCPPPSDDNQADNQADGQAKPKRLKDKPIRESLFSSELNSVDLPWVEQAPEVDKDVVPMTEYEEIQLLKQVENLAAKVKSPNKKAHLHRLKAKLALRRLKRHKHLPVFDFDKAVKVLGGYVTEDPRVEVNVERVLDRFQRSYLLENLCGTISRAVPGALPLSHTPAAPFRSPLSHSLLKPFIRREERPDAPWLRLMDELLTKSNRNIPDYRPPPRASLDYSYVRPQHIAAVNSLCAQFFWPGIDVTESLEYPEHSCVVTYKRLVVAFAFLVPDVGRHEAYISFVFTRPEWRHAKIATFMLYHLLQTCTGKDVTLHVSPTNPAIFLYQKFGFKVEELCQDFYEKYFDIDYKGCRHALFLRLVR